jgi:hypothetical protein
MFQINRLVRIFSSIILDMDYNCRKPIIGQEGPQGCFGTRGKRGKKGSYGPAGQPGQDGYHGDKGQKGDSQDCAGQKGMKGEEGDVVVYSDLILKFGAANIGNIGSNSRSRELDRGFMFPGLYDGIFHHTTSSMYPNWTAHKYLSAGYCLASIKKFEDIEEDIFEFFYGC